MKAIYPGSFDPFTNGHLSIIEKAAEVFTHGVVIGIGQNSKKSGGLMTAQQRQDAIRRELNRHSFASLVTVEIYSTLLVDFAVKKQVKHIVRGLRPLGDFENEFNMATMNRELALPLICETVFFMADSSTAHMSSTLVRELLGYGGDIRPYVPPGVFDYMQQMGIVR